MKHKKRLLFIIVTVLAIIFSFSIALAAQNKNPQSVNQIIDLLENGAGNSGKIPNGLLEAPGIEKKLANFDFNPPVISDVNVYNIGTSTATISWLTDEDSDSVVKYGTSTLNYIFSASGITIASGTDYIHTANLIGLSASTTYYFIAKSTDAAGNLSQSEEYNFNTLKLTLTYLGQWGSNGSGDGQFYGGAYAVDTDSQGNVYVLDEKRIQKFNNQGIFIAKSQWGTGGSGLAIDSQDNIYVVNFEIANTVKKFDSNLNYLATIYEEIITVSPWFGAKDIAIDSNDNLFIADRWKVIKMDTDGNIIKEWGSRCGGGGGQSTEIIGSDSQGNVCLAGEFADAQAIGVDLSNDVYVIEYWLHHVQVFDNDGNYIKKWGGPGSGDGYFRTPGGGAFDSENNIYISDYYNNRVQKLMSDGTFILKWGSSYGNPGSGDGEFYAPRDVAVGPDGSIYVVDHGNYRIQKFGYR